MNFPEQQTCFWMGFVTGCFAHRPAPSSSNGWPFPSKAGRDAFYGGRNLGLLVAGIAGYLGQNWSLSLTDDSTEATRAARRTR